MQMVTITRTETRAGKNGSYVVAHLEGGKRAYVWDGKVAEALAPGVYEAELEERGGFLRLKSARPVTTTNGAQAPQPTEAEGAPTPVQATAQERLEALRVVLTLAQWTRLESVDQALAAAEKVLQWLKGSEGGQG